MSTGLPLEVLTRHHCGDNQKRPRQNHPTLGSPTAVCRSNRSYAIAESYSYVARGESGKWSDH